MNHADDANTLQDFDRQCDIASRTIEAGELITTDARKETDRELVTLLRAYEKRIDRPVAIEGQRAHRAASGYGAEMTGDAELELLLERRCEEPKEGVDVGRHDLVGRLDAPRLLDINRTRVDVP